MLKRMFLALFCCLGLTVAIVCVAQDHVSAEPEMMTNAEDHNTFIDRFAKLARDKDEEGILALLDPATASRTSEKELLAGIRDGLFVAFENYRSLGRSHGVSNALLPDGRIGLWHYEFMVDDEGEVEPFRIAIINTDEGPRALSIVVGECVEGRHPRVPPCD